MDGRSGRQLSTEASAAFAGCAPSPSLTAAAEHFITLHPDGSFKSSQEAVAGVLKFPLQ